MTNSVTSARAPDVIWKKKNIFVRIFNVIFLINTAQTVFVESLGSVVVSELASQGWWSGFNSRSARGIFPYRDGSQVDPASTGYQTCSGKVKAAGVMLTTSPTVC